MSLAAPIRVLVVEDDADSSDALRLLLEHEGFDVQLARSVRETRRHFEPRAHRDRPIDVIVLDLGLPDEDPTHLADELHRLDPPPGIIVHSAAPKDVVSAAAVRLGAMAQIRKPSNCEVLVRSIRAVAERSLPANR